MLPVEQRLLDYIFVDEGGFANVKGDAGGQTRFGVTENLARAYGYTGDMQDLPMSMASSILLHEYWYPTWIKIQVRERLAIKLCDTQMNMPPAEGAKIAQRAINRVWGPSSSRQVTVDGQIGPLTVQALLDPLAPEEALLRAVCIEQEAHYEDLENHFRNDLQFALGWKRRAYRIPDGNGGATNVQL